MHLFLEVALSPGVSPAIQDCVLLPGMQRHSQLDSPTFLFTSRAPHPSWVPCVILSHALNLWCGSLRRSALPDLTCSSRQGRIPPGSSLPGRDHLRCVHRALATRHLTAVTSYTRQDPSPHHSGPSIRSRGFRLTYRCEAQHRRNSAERAAGKLLGPTGRLLLRHKETEPAGSAGEGGPGP